MVTKKETKKPKKIVVDPNDYDDYGDFMAAKRTAEAPKEEIEE